MKNAQAIPSAPSWTSGWARAWNEFWFRAIDPATLSVIRLFAGAMLLYTHAVWSLDLVAFFGPQGWLPRDLLSEQFLSDRPFVWSHFWWIDSPVALWIIHVGTLVVYAMLTLGFLSRITSVLAFLAVVSYAHRVTPGAYFGLDPINSMLAMYLMLGPCGARYSLDAWLKRRKNPTADCDAVAPSATANIAIRLMQLHMCVVYFFSGAAKLVGTPLGAAWWDGTGVWWAVAITEYQTPVDMTWLAGWPALVAALTYATVFWEISYPALIWPRLTRPIVLAVAILAHGGIALFLGMVTFGLAMLIGNLAFVPPEFVHALTRSKTTQSAKVQ